MRTALVALLLAGLAALLVLREGWARGWLPRRVRGDFALPGGGRLHVNRGVGVLVIPLRVGAQAEVTCVTVRAAGNPA